MGPRNARAKIFSFSSHRSFWGLTYLRYLVLTAIGGYEEKDWPTLQPPSADVAQDGG